jgi:hypothetical protein
VPNNDSAVMSTFPLVVDLDEPGRAFDAGWAGSEARFAARRAAQRG